MKKSRAIAIVFLVLAAFLVNPFSAEGQGGGSVYTLDDVTIKFIPPLGWSLSKSNPIPSIGVRFQPEFINHSTAFLTIIAYSGPGTAIFNIDKMMKVAERDPFIIKKEKIKFAKGSAFCTLSVNNGKTTKQIQLMRGNSIFTITFTADEKDFERALPFVDSSLKSFRILSPIAERSEPVQRAEAPGKPVQVEPKKPVQPTVQEKTAQPVSQEKPLQIVWPEKPVQPVQISIPEKPLVPLAQQKPAQVTVIEKPVRTESKKQVQAEPKKPAEAAVPEKPVQQPVKEKPEQSVAAIINMNPPVLPAIKPAMPVVEPYQVPVSTPAIREEGAYGFFAIGSPVLITLKSGTMARGKLMDMSADRIRIDFYGTPLSFNVNDIKEMSKGNIVKKDKKLPEAYAGVSVNDMREAIMDPEAEIRVLGGIKNDPELSENAKVEAAANFKSMITEQRKIADTIRTPDGRVDVDRVIAEFSKRRDASVSINTKRGS